MDGPRRTSSPPRGSLSSDLSSYPGCGYGGGPGRGPDAGPDAGPGARALPDLFAKVCDAARPPPPTGFRSRLVRARARLLV